VNPAEHAEHAEPASKKFSSLTKTKAKQNKK
jgi:hypothetical protein